MITISRVDTGRLLFVFLALLFCGGANAEDVSVRAGDTLKAQTGVNVRATPPSKQFLFIVGEPGKEIQKLKPGESFTVQEVKQIAVPLGTDVWLKGTTASGTQGWVYYGDKDKSSNFAIKQKE